jgi:5-methylcytosine-specific restriction protein B
MSKIWKVSHGFKNIDSDASDWLDDHKYVTVHMDTLKGQADKFRSELAIGDYVCLSRSSDIVALVKVTSEVVRNEESPLSEEWMLRTYEDICRLPVPKLYTSELMRGWTPNYNSTIFSVDARDNAEFEEEILVPYFGLDLISLDNDFQSTKLSVDTGMDTKKLSLNSILFGPPGTGKTFNTINYALSILEPDLDVNGIERKTLKEKYDGYCKAGRIHFVTFHQSFAYEDFVEGIKAEAENGSISYDVKNGVFRKICFDAQNSRKLNSEMSSGCIEEAVLKLKQIIREEGPFTLKTKNGLDFRVLNSSGGGFTIDLLERSEQDAGVGITSLKKAFSGNYSKRADVSMPAYTFPILEYMYEREILKRDSGEQEGLPSIANNYVLIIDEINRGNISSIFGELITLIEPSKRSGEDEALTVTLPYSKKPFSVPSNLHIIGTMNTADRSLALMDTALRRRFDFVEMMPDLEVLKGINVNSIDIPKMLEKMNQRIEVLYDREHTLGHAFFIPLKKAAESERFDMLQSIFKNKILPLLEEYFFEDWEKIRLVLGDNQKQDQGLAFISMVKNNSIGDLFGSDEEAENLGLDEIITYQRNDDALRKAEAYQGIYGK